MSWFDTISGAENGGKLRHESVWRLGGALADLAELSPEDLQVKLALVNADLQEEWKAAVARELLLLAKGDARRFLGVIGAETKPFFEKSLTLGALLADGVDVAAAVIPILVHGEQSGIAAQLWLVRGLQNQESDAALLTDGNAAVWQSQNNVTLILQMNRAKADIGGRSWELGANLALKALRLAAEKMRLAGEWVVTGRIDKIDGRAAVGHVELGNKTALSRVIPKRRWLLPLSVAAEAQQDATFAKNTAGMRHTAVDVDSAWAQISGHSIIRSAALQWADEPLKSVKVLHTFASDALAPRIFSYLRLKPERIVIWYSGKMKQRAEQLRDTCRKLLHGEPELKPCSEDAAHVEEELRADPSLQAGATEPVVFNITGGTNLMRFAPAEIARTLPNLYLLYRAETEPPFASLREKLRFTLLHFPAMQLAEANVYFDEGVSDAEAQAWLDLASANPASLRGREVEGLVELAQSIDEASKPLSAPTGWLFSFAARGLQKFVMTGGKLRDMVGATSLIDQLSSKAWLADCLRDAIGCEPSEYEIVQAAAGSARIIFRQEDSATRAFTLWPLVCRAWAPGLEVVTDLRPIRRLVIAMSEASSAMETARNFPPIELPEAGPFVKRSSRTGLPAVGHEKGEDIDQAERRKRQERGELTGTVPQIAKYFGFKHEKEIPDDFESIAGAARSYLAIVHADGNRVGEMFIALSKAITSSGISDDIAKQLFRHLSEEVLARGTQSAVSEAMTTLQKWHPKAFEKPPWAVAPIVLAGDDVTVVLRADLAIDFTKAFLSAFRAKMDTGIARLRSQKWFSKLPTKAQQAIPASISAGAGIVFCQSHYPFYLAYELCEDIARSAKSEARQSSLRGAPLSAVAFARITGGSAPTEFDELKRATLTSSDGALLTAGPYFLSDAISPSLDALLETATAARRLPKGTLRTLLKLQRTDSAAVKDTVERMLEVAADDFAKEFEEKWCALTGHSADADEWKALRGASGGMEASPLADLLTVLFVMKENEE